MNWRKAVLQMIKDKDRVRAFEDVKGFRKIEVKLGIDFPCKPKVIINVQPKGFWSNVLNVTFLEEQPKFSWSIGGVTEDKIAPREFHKALGYLLEIDHTDFPYEEIKALVEADEEEVKRIEKEREEKAFKKWSTAQEENGYFPIPYVSSLLDDLRDLAKSNDKWEASKNTLRPSYDEYNGKYGHFVERIKAVVQPNNRVVYYINHNRCSKGDIVKHCGKSWAKK